MATPYIAHKVSSGYHQSQVHPNFNCNSNKCRFSYDHWCPNYEVRQNGRVGRRRCKSENQEADPLREHNRPYETPPYQSHHWKRKIGKDYDLCSGPDTAFNMPSSNPSETSLNCEDQGYQSIDGSSNLENIGVPVQLKAVLSNYEGTLYQSSDSSDDVENNSVSFPVRKLRERMLPVPVRASKKCEPWMKIAHNSPDFNNSDHFVSCDSTHSSDLRQNHHFSSPSHKILESRHRRKGGVAVPVPWTCNGDGYQEYNIRTKHSDICTTPNQLTNCKRGDGDSFLCPSLASYPQCDANGLRDAEHLRGKIRELRGGTDGKRLRQRSDSEPVAGCSADGEMQDSKRARDISPSLHHQDISSSCAPEYNGCSGVHMHKHPSHYVHDIKHPEVPPKKTRDTIRKDMPVVLLCARDRVVIDSMGGSDGEAGEDSEEGAISLSDTNKGEVQSWYSGVNVPIQKQLPACLRASLFSHVPPYIQFSLAGTDGDPWPPDVLKLLKWKLSPITPMIVRRTLVSSNFRLVKKSSEWCGTWGKHMKSLGFKSVKDFQKINHFPGTFQIGRKDRLWKNLQRLIMKFGEAEFGFIPHTYVLPQDSKLLRQAWKRGHGKWIIKPPASARGTGIKVINRWAQLPKKKALVVQKYLSDPYLINGSKFDLRLYVLVTSVHPLRIYLYDDGLVRFASVKYSNDVASLGDRYMHLTNYSINKLSSQYTQNEDASACRGHKWTVKSLWKFLKKRGVDVNRLWTRLVDMVIKTIISGESAIGSLARANLQSRYCSFELFGFDVLLDRALKPWLLEVNISPSLHSASPLDRAVKAPMVHDLFNLAGYQIPNKLPTFRQDELLSKYGLLDHVSSLCYDKRLYTTVLSKEERRKHSLLLSSPRSEYLEEILESLTPDDIRHLIQSEDELTQAGRFLRVFPTPDTYKYHDYFEGPRYYNKLFDAWETKYWKCRQEGIQVLERSCSQKVHLTVPNACNGTRSFASQPPLLSMRRESVEWEEEKEEKEMNLPERKVQSHSSVALYRAAKPRNGKAAVVIKPFPRSQYVRKKVKLPHYSPPVTRSKTKAMSALDPVNPTATQPAT